MGPGGQTTSQIFPGFGKSVLYTTTGFNFVILKDRYLVNTEIVKDHNELLITKMEHKVIDVKNNYSFRSP